MIRPLAGILCAANGELAERRSLSVASQPFLLIESSDGAARELPITDKPITVGRHSANLIVLTDGMASRYHCVIEKGQDGLRVRDLDSSNGTRVNGQVIKTWRLGDGDVVQVGKSTLTVHAPSLAPSPKAKAKPVAVPAVEEDDYEVEVVEVDEEQEQQAPGGAGYEALLARMAESLVDKKFGEDDIALINARGALSHPAKPPGANNNR